MLAFFDLSIPAPRRLAAMRAAFDGHAKRYPRCPESAKPRSWRDVRGTTLQSFREYHGCLSRGAEEWYCHTGTYFEGREVWADDVANIKHTGWYTDADCHEKARGFVVRLPRGRYLAGYEWSSNGARTYLPRAYACDMTAAHAADRAAERFAESACADDERFRAMTDAEGHAEAVESDVRNAWEARHASAYWREHCRERIAELRAARADLQRARAAYERGEA